MVDRVRERSGRESEQDIELTREEIVQEYLQDVKIVDRRIDEENKICTATAVMPKSREIEARHRSRIQSRFAFINISALACCCSLEPISDM